MIWVSTVCDQCIINNAVWVAVQASFHWFTLSSVQVFSCSFLELFSSSALTTYVSFVTDVCMMILESYINERFEIMKCVDTDVEEEGVQVLQLWLQVVDSCVKIDWLSQVLTSTKHIIGHIGDGFLWVKWPNQQCQRTEEREALRIRFQCHQVHPTALTILQQLCNMKQKHTEYIEINTHKSIYAQWNAPGVTKPQSREL